MSDDRIEAWRLDRFRKLVRHAYRHVPFYTSLYDAHGFDPESLRTLDDFERVPIVTKEDLRAWPLEERGSSRAGAFLLNTGGTSGSPLEFHVDRRAFAREWAHMHEIWSRRGYKPGHIKLTLRGRNLGADTVLRYNGVHNEYVVNAYVPMTRVAEEVERLVATRRIRWIHGYPSIVAELAQTIDGGFPRLAAQLRGSLHGVLLGSEYPAPPYRETIERVLSTNVVSWYGHSEMAVLALESSRYTYESMPTYGWAEAVPVNDADRSRRLVCTSYHNLVHPFIRYDTGDLVEPLAAEAGRLTFRVVEGRTGDYITDHTGNRIFLTALIFGRHHAGFEKVKHVQVRQTEPGRATLILVPRNGESGRLLLDEFDLSDVAIEWSVELRAAPLRTAAGKIRLKVDA